MRRPGVTKLIDPKDSDKVFVNVTAYNSRKYYVEGEVNYPSRLKSATTWLSTPG